MTANVPHALGARTDWPELPARVRAAVEEWLGSPVVAAVTQAGGFSPGVAARLRAADGRRVFLKAVGSMPNLESPELHRREGRIVAALPPTVPVPRLLWSLDEGDDGVGHEGGACSARSGAGRHEGVDGSTRRVAGWVVLAFEDVEGRHPTLPWRPGELDRVLAALDVLAEDLTPSPLPPSLGRPIAEWLETRGQGWRRALEARPVGLDAWSARHLRRLADLEALAPAAGAGDTLLHFDLRADNLLLTPDRVVVVDWPHARVGAAWVDLVFFAPSVGMQGGPSPEALLARSEAAQEADPDAVTAVVAAIAGFFTYQALQPPPPGIPTVRAFQAAQGAVARRWLAERTGWE